MVIIAQVILTLMVRQTQGGREFPLYITASGDVFEPEFNGLELSWRRSESLTAEVVNDPQGYFVILRRDGEELGRYWS